MEFFYLFSYFLLAVIFAVICSLPFVLTIEILKFYFSVDVPHKDKLDIEYIHAAHVWKILRYRISYRCAYSFVKF